jgi:hypothetical protein
VELGLAYDEEGNVLDRAYRQIIANGDRLFLNAWSEDYGQKFNPPMLTEVRLVPYKGGFQFDKVGPNFDPMWEETKQFSQNFKLRWVVEKPGEYDKLFVMNQLQSELSIYFFSRNKVQDEEYVALPLKDYTRSSIFPRSEEENRWLFSFSRNTGFYSFGDGFLVGYTVPRLDYDYKSKEEWNNDERPFNLYLQPIARTFEVIQERKIFEKAYLAGVYLDTAYVIEANDNKCRLIKVKF